MNNTLPFSLELGPLKEVVEDNVENYKKRWHNADTSFPEFARVYTKNDQRENEDKLTRFMQQCSEDLKQIDEDKNVNDLPIEKYFNELFDIFKVEIDSRYRKGYIRSTDQFVQKAKQFDPELQIENVYQALRNVWIMNSLQVYMREELACSNSLFAYSMFYPYTDNILDDEQIPAKVKLQVHNSLRRWLEGESFSAQSEIEHKLNKLVRKIENEFSRENFPEVFPSILTIFNAQLRSLLQQKKISYEDLLDISFEKGGTSVLADGYLVNGKMSEQQIDFSFGFGIFLQLGDDLQDVTIDKRNRHYTVYSSEAGSAALDRNANKLFNFTMDIVETHLSAPEQKFLKSLISENCFFMMIEAVGKNKHLFSRKYIKSIEPYFPVRFSYLKKLRKKLKQNFLNQYEKVMDIDTVSASLLSCTARLCEG